MQTASRGNSPAELLALLPESERVAFLASLTPEENVELLWNWRHFWARPNQIAPPGEWLSWIVRAGRGFGKTRTGAEWCQERALAFPGHWMALIAKTPADARDFMIEGPSGLCVISRPDQRPTYQPSIRRLVWPNGTWATIYSSEEPSQLRGFSGLTAWLDEFAKYTNPREVWEQLSFGMREASTDRPRRLITTTPRPLDILKEIEADPNTVTTLGSSLDNRANLDPTWFSGTLKQYQGTRLGRQEINAEYLDDVPGALWSRDLLDRTRVLALPELRRVVVAVDPNASVPTIAQANRRSESASSQNLCGIVVCGLGTDGHGYVLEDLSGRYSPAQWAQVVVLAFDKWRADRIIAEGNQGGAMVSHTLATVRANLPVKLVFARRGKQARAEPIAALFEANP